MPKPQPYLQLTISFPSRKAYLRARSLVYRFLRGLRDAR